AAAFLKRIPAESNSNTRVVPMAQSDWYRHPSKVRGTLKKGRYMQSQVFKCSFIPLLALLLSCNVTLLKGKEDPLTFDHESKCEAKRVCLKMLIHHSQLKMTVKKKHTHKKQKTIQHC
uniref:Uncharacterized protein n=1 Tax=Hippocampus comes TaxID=109280 RepID=A0A3Q2YJR8_HIPCM